MFVPIRDLIHRSINKHGLKKTVTALEVINECKKVMRESLGEEALLDVVPRVYKDNKVFVEVSSSAWSHHFHLHQNNILDTLNKNLGSEKVKTFVTKIANKSLTT